MKTRSPDSGPGFWPAVADSLLGSLMMVLLLAMGGVMMVVMQSRPAPGSDTIESLQKKLDQSESKLNEEFVSKAELLKEIEKLNALLRMLKRSTETEGKDLADKNKALGIDLSFLRGEVKRLEDDKLALLDLIKSLEKQIAGLNLSLEGFVGKAPQIIVLNDVTSFSFESGKAELSPAFIKDLHDIHFQNFVKEMNKNKSADTIEIIGHTDDNDLFSRGPPRKFSSLDRDLKNVMKGVLAANAVQPGSNVDLGLMRALAIMQEWKRWSAGEVMDPRIKNMAVRAYSASYGVAPGVPPESPGLEAKAQKESFERQSRRIEVRFTRLKSS